MSLIFEDENQAIGLSALIDRASRALRQTFRAAVWVRVEVHARKDHRNGHVFLDIVDTGDAAVKASADLWARDGAQRLAMAERARGEPLANGETVFLLVNPELKARFGFRLTVLDIAFADVLGPAERARLNAIKQLQAEGLFEANKRLPAPVVPLRVALVAPVGAEGRRDFETVIARAPVRLRHFPATFQSEAAKTEIPQAIRAAAAWEPDVIVLARGGGAKADLMFLNAYDIGRAICLCPVPVFSGIGHAADETLIDNVAHLAAPTPTAAANRIAELVNEAVRASRETVERVARVATAAAERASAATSAARRTSGLCGEHALKTARTQAQALHALAQRQAADALARARARVEKLIALPHKPHELLRERVAHLLAQVRGASGRLLLAAAEAQAKQQREALAQANGVAARADAALRHALAASRASALHAAAIADPRPVMVRVAGGVAASLRAASERIRHERKAGTDAAQAGVRLARAQAASVFAPLRPLSRGVVAAAFSACERQLAQALRHDIEGPLRNGFALVLDPAGRRVRSAASAPEAMRIQFHDGDVAVRKTRED